MATEDETTLVTAVCLPMTALLHRYKQIKYEHLVAGIAGGVVSTSILHPLDTIRTRLAGAAPQHKQLYTHNFKGCNNNCEIDIFQKNSKRQSADLCQCPATSLRRPCRRPDEHDEN
jgi:hypothetical protein